MDFILEAKGFGNRWSKCVRGCCWNSNFSILINGRPRGKITASRGIRQGDPLSPFLFSIMADSLSRFIRVCSNKGFIKGFKVGKEEVEASHIQYADDTLLFSDGNVQFMKNWPTFLKFYEKASGLPINMQKTGIIGINVEEGEVTCLAELLGCKAEFLPFKYLGVIVGGRPKDSLLSDIWYNYEYLSYELLEYQDQIYQVKYFG